MGLFDALAGATPSAQPGALSSLAGLSLDPAKMVPVDMTTPVASDRSGPSGWQNAAGIIGDALLTAFGHQAVYGPTALAYAKMQPDALDQQYKRAQIAALQAKPAGPAPTEFQRDYEWLKTINPSAADSFLTNKTTAPPIVQHNDDGTLSVYPAGTVPRSSAPMASDGALPPGFKVRGAGSGQPGFR